VPKVKLRSIWDVIHKRTSGCWFIFNRGMFHMAVMRQLHGAVIQNESVYTFPDRDMVIQTYSQKGELWLK
jgi:hypothetical protein